MTTFADRLIEALSVRNMKPAELSRRTGIPEGTISQYKKGLYEPKQKKLHVIAETLGVSVDWLMGYNVPMTLSKEQVKERKWIPVLGTVRAGIPIEAVENIIDYEEISEDMARQGEFFALQIKGDSMEPKISEGDVVIVRKQSDVDSGNIAIVLVNGEEATIKKIQKFDGGINLIPSNPSYDVRTYTNDQIESLPVQILGKVVELRAKFA